MKNIKDYEIQFELEDEMNDQELVEIHIGDVNLPTGKIIVADPFFTVEQRPFARTVEPDKYPVFIYMSEIDSMHHRIAYAKIKFRPETATRWILALTEDITAEEIQELGEEEFYGFPVESGLACFLDEKTNGELIAKIEALQEKEPESNYYDAVLSDDHHPDKDSDDNAIMFASGWGDGYYPAYWGLNENGDIIELVIDFLINEFEDDDEDYNL